MAAILKTKKCTILEQKQDVRTSRNSVNSLLFSHIFQSISLISLALQSSHHFLPKEAKMRGMFNPAKSLSFVPGLSPSPGAPCLVPTHHSTLQNLYAPCVPLQMPEYVCPYTQTK